MLGDDENDRPARLSGQPPLGLADHEIRPPAPTAPMRTIAKIISGGQTGADRGGLDAAIECAVPHGGWCPRGRKSEDGVIPAHYNLVETKSTAYPVRTEANIVDAHCTVVFTFGKPTGGSKKTVSLAERPSQRGHVLTLD